MIFPCSEDKVEMHTVARLKQTIQSQWKWGINLQLWGVIPFLQKELMDLLTKGKQAMSLHVAIQGIPQVLCEVGCREKLQARAARTRHGLFLILFTGVSLGPLEKDPMRHCSCCTMLAKTPPNNI